MNEVPIEKDEKYLIIKVNEPLKVLNFLVQKMGFYVSPDNKAVEGTRLFNSYGNRYLLLINTAHTPVKPTNNDSGPILINTTDCLEEYFIMKRIDGITIDNKPDYVEEGLAFELSDKWNNRYMVLERRDYSEY